MISASTIGLLQGAPRIPIGRLCSLQNGRAFKPTEWVDAGTPIIRIQNLNDSSKDFNYYSGDLPERFRVRHGDVLLSWSGTPGTSFGCFRWKGPDGWLNQHIFNVRLNPEIIQPDYFVLHVNAILSELIGKAHGGVGLRHITKGQLDKIELSVPSFEVQSRIVDLLSRAENIVRMRREAEKNAKEIIPALFLDLFGDPATNPKGWPTQTFRDIGTLDRGKSRHRPRDAPHLYGGPHPFVQTGDVARSGGVITAYAQTYSDAGLAQSKLWPVGTLCITIAANIAETGVLAFEACFPDSVVGFLPGENVRTDYIQNWLHFLKPTLAAQAPQAAQKNINLEILRNLNVPIPPMSLQVVFEKYVKQLRSTEACQLAATTVGDRLFQSLLAQVFSDGVAI
jgi:type I restriction enzyme S subunit